MKTFFTFLMVTLFIGMPQLSYSQLKDFILKTDKDTININAGETAVFNLDVTTNNGFDASIFLTLSTGEVHISSGIAKLSTDIINAPYRGVKLTVTSTANFTKDGVYEYRITGSNGSQSDALCFVNVSATSRKNWRFVSGNNGVPDFIVQDKEGNYWQNDGMDQFLYKENRNTQLEYWGSKNASFGVNYLYLPPKFDTKNNKIWISTYNWGLLRFNLDGTYKTIYNTLTSPMPDDFAIALDVDNKTGDVWVGTKKGLARLQGSVWTVYDSTNSALGKEPITGIIVSDSIVWVGTTNGLVKFDGTTWTRFTPQNSSMPAGLVRGMALDINGDIWMGLSNETFENNPTSNFGTTFYGLLLSMVGLAKFDGINWSLFNNTNSPLDTSNYVNAIAIDKKGNKWIATASRFIMLHDSLDCFGGGGILKFDNTKWTAFTTENSPLPDNRINWVGVDNDNNIWFCHVKDFYRPPGNFWGVYNEDSLSIPQAPTGIHEEPKYASNGILIYPNPTSSSFTITGADGGSAIRVINSLGMEVISRSETSGKKQIDVTSLPNGLYFVNIHTSTGTVVKPVLISR